MSTLELGSITTLLCAFLETSKHQISRDLGCLQERTNPPPWRTSFDGKGSLVDKVTIDFLNARVHKLAHALRGANGENSMRRISEYQAEVQDYLKKVKLMRHS